MKFLVLDLSYTGLTVYMYFDQQVDPSATLKLFVPHCVQIISAALDGTLCIINLKFDDIRVNCVHCTLYRY